MPVLVSPKYLSFDPKQPIFSLCHVIPSLDYDKIPNLNDLVQLTNGNYGKVIKLFYNKKQVIYHIKLNKNVRFYWRFLYRICLSIFLSLLYRIIKY